MNRKVDPRRVMPGRPLPDKPTRTMDLGTLTLIRGGELDSTTRVRFFLSDTNQPQSGARGLTLDKLDKTDPYPHGFGFAVEGEYKWGFGMDFETDNLLGDADYVPAFDHSANDGAGADVIRLSMARASTSGPLSTKIAFGERGGSPAANTEAFLFAGGDTVTSLGGARINFWSSGTSRFALALINAHGSNNNCLVNFNDQFYVGTDITGSGAQTFHIWDQVAAALRLTMDSSGRIKIGTGSPTAVLHLPAGAAAASGAPLKFTSGTNLTAAEAGVFEFDGTDFFATPVATRKKMVLAPTAPSAYTPTNVTTDRAYDANATTLDEIADVLGTLIADLQATKIIG